METISLAKYEYKAATRGAISVPEIEPLLTRRCAAYTGHGLTRKPASELHKMALLVILTTALQVAELAG